MAIPSLDEMVAGMSKEGRLTLDGMAIARTLARGRDYYTAHTMALLWAEAAQVVARREDGKEGDR